MQIRFGHIYKVTQGNELQRREFADNYAKMLGDLATSFTLKQGENQFDSFVLTGRECMEYEAYVHTRLQDTPVKEPVDSPQNKLIMGYFAHKAQQAFIKTHEQDIKLLPCTDDDLANKIMVVDAMPAEIITTEKTT